MVYKKQHISIVIVASIISIGMVSSFLLSSPTSNQVFAQVKTGSNMGMMNGTAAGGNNNMSMMMNSMQKQSGMNAGSMKTNMTMDQMLDMMDMMHNMMMNMMRMMAHGGAMKGGSMTGNSNNTTMSGMQ
jgi:hypothetical protein